MADTFAFVTGWLKQESLRILMNKTVCAEYANTDDSDEFQRPFAIGETTLRKYPQRFLVRDGLAYNEQPIARRTTPITISEIFGVDFAWDSIDKALRMERSEASIKREYLEPAMSQLATELDVRFIRFATRRTNNIVGVLGTTPTAMSTFSRARTLLMENSCTPGVNGTFITPAMNEAAVAANAAVFNPQPEISDEFREGYVGKYAGSKWWETMNLIRHTAGTWQGAVTVNTTLADGATSMIVNCTSGDTFKDGDVFSVASVNNVNPATRLTTNRSKTIAVVGDVTASASTATLTITPALYGPGSQYQNCDRLPTASDALTLWPGTSSPNGKSGVNGIRLNRDAFALVGVPMETPRSAELAFAQRDPQTGISVRFVRAWDQLQSKFTNRFDVLCGFGVFYNDNCAVRIASLN